MGKPLPDFHVVPINDLIEHVEVRQCWCRPRVDEDGLGATVVIHHSADGREYLEEDHDEDEGVYGPVLH